MRAGNWHPGSSILLDENGNLFDGQHRLEAVVESGYAQWFLVVEGLERGLVQPVTDRGKGRTFGQCLQIEGLRRASGLAAAYRSIWLYLDQGWLNGQGASVTPTIPELLALRAEHPNVKVFRPIRGLPEGAYSGFIYLASIGTPEDAKDFHEKLQSGIIGPSRGERSIATLRERITTEAAKTNPIPTGIRVIFLVRAWNAWQAGEDLSRLVFRPGGSHPDNIPTIAGCPLLPRRRESN
jgi:hypothetical protein